MRTTNGASDYIQLDSLRLDGYGWNYKRAIAPNIPSTRSAASSMPGRPGRVYAPGADVHEPAEINITVQVFPAHPVTGLVESNFNQRRAQLEDNLQTLLGVIGRPGRALTYRYVDADGTAWTARAVVVVPAKVTIRENNFTADITFTLEIPEVYLRSQTAVSQSVAAGTNREIAALAGGTAPIYDAVLTVPGTATNPRISVGDQFITHRGTVTDWTVDTANMTSLNGAGVSVIEDTGWSGTSMLALQPSVDADGAHSYLITATHAVEVTAKKARFA